MKRSGFLGWFHVLDENFCRARRNWSYFDPQNNFRNFDGARAPLETYEKREKCSFFGIFAKILTEIEIYT